MNSRFLIKSFKPIFVVFCVVFLLTSCDLISNQKVRVLGNVVVDTGNYNSDYYLNKAEQAPDHQQKLNFKLLAAMAMLNENKTSMAQSLLNEITPVNKEQETNKTLILANIYANLAKNDNSVNILQNINPSSLNKNQQELYYQAYAKYFTNKKQYIGAINALNKQYELLSNKQRQQQNIDKTWDLLLNLDTNTINLSKNNLAPNTVLYGWLNLIENYKTNLSQPDRLKTVLNEWMQRYPQHPGKKSPPTALTKLNNYSVTRVNKIGLLLPFTGNLSKMSEVIKAGFMEANQNQIQVIDYDTNNNQVNQILAQAKTDGVDSIAGPLLKQRVSELVNNNLQGLNILALNSNRTNPRLGNVCYFGLTPEVEAKDAAKFMWQRGVRHPIVLIVNNDVGLRASEIFKQSWQQLANNQTTVKLFTNQENLQQIINSLADNSQDNMPDAVYLVSNNQELTLVKNILSTNEKTKDIAIYASSRSNSYNNTVNFATVMQDVQFSDIPLFKNPSSAIYNKAQQVAGNDYTLLRLYAMGYDAFNLTKNIRELNNISGYKLMGLTGELNAGENCVIEKKFSWFQYNNGSLNIIQ